MAITDRSKVNLLVLCLILVALVGSSLIIFAKFDRKILIKETEAIFKQLIAERMRLKFEFKGVDYSQFARGKVSFSEVTFLDYSEINELSIIAPEMMVEFSLKDLLFKKVNLKKVIFENASVFIQKNYRKPWNAFSENGMLDDSMPENSWKVIVNRWDFVDSTVEFSLYEENRDFHFQIQNASFIIISDIENKDLWEVQGMGNEMKSGKKIDFATKYSWSKDTGYLIFNYGEEELSGEGEYSSLRTKMQWEGELTYKSLDTHSFDIDDVITVSGTTLLQGDFFIEGYHLADWTKTVRSTGSVAIRNGIIQGINPFHALQQLFQDEFPSIKKSDVENNDLQKLMDSEKFLTFDKFQADFNVDRHHISFSSLLISTESFIFELEGQASSAAKTVEFYGELVLLKLLSSQWITSFEQFNFSLNHQERFVLPLIYRGVIPFATVDTDRDYLNSVYKYGASTSVEDEAPLDLTLL